MSDVKPTKTFNNATDAFNFIFEKLEELEKRTEVNEAAMGNLSDILNEAQNNSYALQISTMLLMLKTMNANTKTLDTDIRSYLDMGRIFAKHFIESGKTSDRP